MNKFLIDRWLHGDILDLSSGVPSSKLTWQQKMDLVKMYLLLKKRISIAMLVHQRVILICLNVLQTNSLSKIIIELTTISQKKKYPKA